MVSRTVFNILCIVLVLQLVTIRPSFFVFETRAVGEFVTASKDAAAYATNVVTEATLSAAHGAPQHDSLIFTGDVMLGRHVEYLMNRYGSQYPYSGFSLSQLSDRPAVIGNFESAMAVQHQPTPPYRMRFSVAGEHLAAFSEQFTHASLANNHALDYGDNGYYNAVTHLEAQSVTVFGHGTDISRDSISYIETTRGTVAILGINATQRIPEEEEIFSVCSRAKRQSDFQVVYVHWGDEYEILHSDTQRVLAEVLVDACADLVIGHHPHVVQDVDIIKGVPVFYSLGNYIFDQYFSEAVRTGLVVALRFEETPVLELLPVSSVETPAVPTPLQPSDQAAFLKDLAARSHPSLKTSLEAGRVNLFELVATSTKMAIMWR